MKTTLRIANLSLLILFPVSWFMPLLHTGLLRPRRIPFTERTLFELDTVTIISGLQALWASSAVLALVVTAAAIFFPMLKTIGVALIQFDLMSPKLSPILAWAGKFAMADIFLISLYILIFKGIGLGHVNVAWGMYLFTACVVASIIVFTLTEKNWGRG
ncbi:paraquat-inducible protein A [Paracoccus sp. (in: a-proteobacteria)]|uniref:paraquat-inducible protein A n=1 Tax=Paracoccus sp. TaxID=267 RepID=UPI0026DFB960|nr:paraquat-inducible protein A [Paracoccus sp. (in: a-proteobacteria)]MDO5646799.1 paraquat-inducible protein A [Paracoccus sp. (in: a-proteobacteria)]